MIRFVVIYVVVATCCLLAVYFINGLGYCYVIMLPNFNCVHTLVSLFIPVLSSIYEHILMELILLERIKCY